MKNLKKLMVLVFVLGLAITLYLPIFADGGDGLDPFPFASPYPASPLKSDMPIYDQAGKEKNKNADNRLNYVEILPSYPGALDDYPFKTSIPHSDPKRPNFKERSCGSVMGRASSMDFVFWRLLNRGYTNQNIFNNIDFVMIGPMLGDFKPMGVTGWYRLQSYGEFRHQPRVGDVAWEGNFPTSQVFIVLAVEPDNKVVLEGYYQGKYYILRSSAERFYFFDPIEWKKRLSIGNIQLIINNNISHLAGIPFYDAYLKGTSKGLEPYKLLTRAELATIWARLLNLEPQPKPIFDDVPLDHWANAYIAVLQEKGIMTGVSDKSFLPDKTLTVAELIATVYKYWEYSGFSKLLYTDKSINSDLWLSDKKWILEGRVDQAYRSHWSAEMIKTTIDYGLIQWSLMTKYDDTTKALVIDPNRAVTRSMAAELFNKLTGRTGLAKIIPDKHKAAIVSKRMEGNWNDYYKDDAQFACIVANAGKDEYAAGLTLDDVAYSIVNFPELKQFKDKLIQDRPFENID